MPRIFATLYFSLNLVLPSFDLCSYTFSHTKQKFHVYVEIFVERKQFSSGFQAIFFSVPVGRRSANAYTAFVKLREHTEIQQFHNEYSCRFEYATLLRKILCSYDFIKEKRAASRIRCRKRKTHGNKRTTQFRMKRDEKKSSEKKSYGDKAYARSRPKIEQIYLIIIHTVCR